MKTKVLFTAALMVAAASGVQAAPNAGSNMLVQLLESQRFEGVSLLADEDKVRPEQDNTDVTKWIVNPSFDENNTAGWRITAGGVGFTGGGLNYNQGIPEAVANQWTHNLPFDMSQQLTGLPAGKYELSVQAWMDNANRAYLYSEGTSYADAVVADGITGNLQDVDEHFKENETNHRVVVENIIVTDGNLNVGIKCSGGNGWLVFDNFKLKYVDNGLVEILALYKEKVVEINNLADDADAQPLLDRLKEMAKEDVAEDNPDALAAAYTAIVQLQAVYQSPEIAVLKERIEDYRAIAANSSEEIAMAVNKVIKDAIDSLGDVTTTEDVQAVSENLIAAFQGATSGKEYVVVDENFDDGTADGWSTQGAFGNGVMEFFNTNFDFNREFTNLQDGWYQLTLNGFYRNGAADQGASYNANSYKSNWRVYGDDYEIPLMCIYAEDGTTGKQEGDNQWAAVDGDFPAGLASAATNFANEKYVNTLNVWVSGGTLRIGVKGEGTDGSRWCCLDNIKLTYKGSDMAAMYDAMQDNAESLATGFGMTAYAEELAQLQPETKDEAAIEDMNTRTKTIIELVNGMVDFPTNLSAYQSTIEEVLANSEASEEARSFYTDLQNLSLANVTSLEDMDVEKAYRDYLVIANPVGDYKFDMTYLLTNPNAANWDRNGWDSDLLGNKDETVDGEWVDRNEHGVSNNGAYQGETQSSWFVEKWSNDAWDQLDGNGWTIYQRAIVPAGAYQMTAATFTDLPWNALGRVSGVADASLTVGFGSGTLVDGAPIEWVEHDRFTDANDQNNNSNNQNALKYREVSFTLTEAATAENPLKLGIYIGENNDADWFGINDMKLYKVAPKPVELTLDEAQAYSVTTDTYANVTLKRNLKADGKWNTFCVPFDMTAEQLTNNGISEVRRFSGVSTSGNSVILTAETVSDGVKAGVPYIVQVNSNVSEIKVDDVTVQAAAPTAQNIGYADVAGQVAITGNYSATTVPQGAYFISDNVFYVADAEANVTLNGFRAYITVEEGNEASQVNRMLIDINGEVTAIEDVLGESAADSAKAVDVYTLSGVKVKSGVKKAEALDGLQRGIYIVDGQKVIK